MKIIKYPPRENWDKIITRPVFDHSHLLKSVKSILEDVRLNGDKAVAVYSEKFDKVILENFAVPLDEIDEAEQLIPEALKEAIRLASANIETFHRSQQLITQKIETMPGVVCWQKSTGIEKVGLYIPGGTAPLFSTVLMLAIPARIAGCREIVLCSPPAKDGKINPAILYVARQAGVSRIFKIGGVQAIAAMAYGTETVPKVYKIFGPGNQYVTAAKQLAAMRDVAIDMPAGPSEVEVIADETSNPAFVAADMLSQTEHGVDSQAILVTTCEDIVDKVVVEIKRQLNELPRKELTECSLEHSCIVVLKDHNELIDFTNAYAPEHLIIETKDYATLADQVINAGSVFLGHFTPESAGDYASGTNHTLPTNGYARIYSGVNLDSFVKKITFQEISQQGIRNIGQAIEIMAQAESLQAHSNAVSLRMVMTRKQLFQKVLLRFKETMPVAETELSYRTPYELLVAVILSAQCTDKRVNKITPSFFERFPTAELLAEAKYEEVFDLIRSCSYPNNKTKHLIGMAKTLVGNYGGVVPRTVEELMKLPGVGRKTANVIASVIFNQPTIAVDTHVFRVSHRLGLTQNAKNPLDAEKQLTHYIPENLRAVAHHWLILHGRYVCTARVPKCVSCHFTEWCNYYRIIRMEEK